MKERKKFNKVHDVALEHKAQQFKVIGPESDHEYNLIVTGYDDMTYFHLYASEYYLWSEHIKGTLMLSLIDNGDEIVFSEDLKTIDYEVIQEMKILMNFREYWNAIDNPISNVYTVVQETVLIKT